MEKNIDNTSNTIDINKVLTIKEVNQLSPLVLAWIGDSIYSNYVRKYLILYNKGNINTLHKDSTRFVKAKSQANVVKKMMDTILDDQEILYVKKGRNANISHSAKNASVLDYRYATGFEALLGYLELTGQSDRLEELCLYAINELL